MSAVLTMIVTMLATRGDWYPDTGEWDCVNFQRGPSAARSGRDEGWNSICSQRANLLRGERPSVLVRHNDALPVIYISSRGTRVSWAADKQLNTVSGMRRAPPDAQCTTISPLIDSSPDPPCLSIILIKCPYQKLFLSHSVGKY